MYSGAAALVQRAGHSQYSGGFDGGGTQMRGQQLDQTVAQLWS